MQNSHKMKVDSSETPVLRSKTRLHITFRHISYISFIRRKLNVHLLERT